MVSLNTKIGLPRLVIVGCGDVGMRLLPLIRDRYRVFAVTTQAERAAELRAAGAIPLVADLDHPSANLARIGRLAQVIVHLAPSPATGERDVRTRRLAAILPEHAQVVYISTTGVYGNCDGATFDETRPTRPASARARRRVDAESVLRAWAKRRRGRLAILRVPGIYGKNRLPLQRLQSGTPALDDVDDVYTNHVHHDDLAMMIVHAIDYGRSQRIYHATDDSDMKMAAYFDLVADFTGLPRPPRLPRNELATQVSPVMLSFMSESRRLLNTRIKSELGVKLRYPTVKDALPDCL
jgi:nucleoside-diphosphate-sugar epimerase